MSLVGSGWRLQRLRPAAGRLSESLLVSHVVEKCRELDKNVNISWELGGGGGGGTREAGGRGGGGHKAGCTVSSGRPGVLEERPFRMSVCLQQSGASSGHPLADGIANKRLCLRT